jgi:DNA-binding transcriptional regulator YiaG
MKCLTPKDLAERWHVSKKTLYNWRQNGAGPDFFWAGSSVRYLLRKVNEYEKFQIK